MKDKQNNRKRLLNAMLEYADKSGKFNPHFYKKEMMDSLRVTEGQFNIIQKSLGDKYCHYVDSLGGGDRYSINVSECLALKEKYDQERINERRHKQLVWLAVIVVILSAVLGTALSLWFLK